MAGHLFVARGDLTKLACDAWLLPTDVVLKVEDSWLKTAPASVQSLRDPGKRLNVSTPPGWGNYGLRVRRFEEWPGDCNSTPRPWLVNVGGWEGMPSEWYIEGVRQFLTEVATELTRRHALYGRVKPLIALPLAGTRDGAARTIKGDVTRGLLGALRVAAAQHDIDVVLVAYNAPAHAAAQAARSASAESYDQDNWAELEGLREHAERLARHAADGKLVLFLGAGVSKAAGLPDWEELIWKLAEEAGLKDERGALERLNVLDRAQIIARRLASEQQRLTRRIVEETSADHYALGHALLAALPVNEAVTTNYDTLFEEASAAAGRPVAVLPYEAALGQARWLLKLHGSTDRPDDIVLTREDYLRYADRRAALAGIVQALLITRHMLFIGFSLTDDNFHRIVDDVRKAVRSPSSASAMAGRFGTALVLSRQPLWQEFWKHDLTSVCLAESGDTVPQAARRLEIFLDYLTATATTGAQHLLDDSFDGVLTPEERTLREALRTFKRSVPDDVRRSLIWNRVAVLLNDLGDPSPEG